MCSVLIKLYGKEFKIEISLCCPSTKTAHGTVLQRGSNCKIGVILR